MEMRLDFRVCWELNAVHVPAGLFIVSDKVGPQASRWRSLPFEVVGCEACLNKWLGSRRCAQDHQREHHKSCHSKSAASHFVPPMVSARSSRHRLEPATYPEFDGQVRRSGFSMCGSLAAAARS